MNERGKSDKSIVSKKPANKVGSKTTAAEPVEKRDLAKSNSQKQTSRRAQYRERLQHALRRIRKVVKQDKIVFILNSA